MIHHSSTPALLYRVHDGIRFQSLGRGITVSGKNAAATTLIGA
jgi:hypothetical protein